MKYKLQQKLREKDSMKNYNRSIKEMKESQLQGNLNGSKPKSSRNMTSNFNTVSVGNLKTNEQETLDGSASPDFPSGSKKENSIVY